MMRSTAEGGLEPLVRSRTFPLVAAYWSFGLFWGVWVATVGIMATGLFAREKGAT